MTNEYVDFASKYEKSNFFLRVWAQSTFLVYIMDRFKWTFQSGFLHFTFLFITILRIRIKSYVQQCNVLLDFIGLVFIPILGAIIGYKSAVEVYYVLFFLKPQQHWIEMYKLT